MIPHKKSPLRYTQRGLLLYDLRGIGSRGLLPVKIGPVIAKEIAVITSIIVIAKIVIVGIIKVIICLLYTSDAADE